MTAWRFLMSIMMTVWRILLSIKSMTLWQILQLSIKLMTLWRCISREKYTPYWSGSAQHNKYISKRNDDDAGDHDLRAFVMDED